MNVTFKAVLAALLVACLLGGASATPLRPSRSRVTGAEDDNAFRSGIMTRQDKEGKGSSKEEAGDAPKGNDFATATDEPEEPTDDSEEETGGSETAAGDSESEDPTDGSDKEGPKEEHTVSEEEMDKVVPKLLGNGWEQTKDYPIGVSEGQGLILRHAGQDHLFVAGGYLHGTNFEVTSKTYSIDFSGAKDGSTEWVRRADMPEALTHVAQAAVGSRMYMCGGFLGKHPGPSVRSCFVYDLSTDKWQQLPPLPHRRAGGGMVYIKRRNALLYAGGAEREKGTEDGVDHDDSYMLDLGNQKRGWVRKASFRNPRNHMSAITVDGRYFFVGGQHRANEETGNQKSLDEYLEGEDRWVQRADMRVGVGHVSASTPRWGGGFLVIGGVRNGRKKTGAVLFYDMKDDAWVEVGHYVHPVQTPVCGVVGSEIFCATGAGNSGDWKQSYVRGIGHGRDE